MQGAARTDYDVTLDQGSTRILDVPGPEGAMPVVLLHGLGATAKLNWGPCFGPLSQHFRVLAPDHRGHGGGLRTSRFRLEECADDAVAVARARGVSRFIAVGYSMGGPIASLVWRRHPEAVAGLVLCATSGSFRVPPVARPARGMLNVAAELARITPSAARMRIRQRLLSRVEEPELRERLASEFEGHDPRSVLQATHALTGFSASRWLGEVDVPTAVLVTTRDELVAPGRQRRLAASIPGAAVFDVHGDHGACADRGSRFVPTLVEACRGVEKRIAAGA